MTCRGKHLPACLFRSGTNLRFLKPTALRKCPSQVVLRTNVPFKEGTLVLRATYNKEAIFVLSNKPLHRWRSALSGVHLVFRSTFHIAGHKIRIIGQEHFVQFSPIFAQFDPDGVNPFSQRK